ncbi:MAG: ribonuclease P protein subunit [Candidatus Diapherotrites archaeon]|nr:ribonuclease P protein subunit [Candidatus Diapherotrites archaeon]
MLKGKHYEITKKNIFGHEIVGLEAEVIESSDKNKKGMKGIVVDESKNVLTIEAGSQEKKVPKKEAVFEFALGSEKARVDGKKIMFRPQDRVKIFWRGM